MCDRDLLALQDDQLYTADEAAPYLKVTARYLKRGAARDTVQHTYVGRFPRWSAQNIRDIVAGVEHKPRPHRAKRASR